MSEKDCYQEAVGQEIRQLSTALKEADIELVDIEEMLGVKEPDSDVKHAGYSDVPRRLDVLIGIASDLGRRLATVHKMVCRLKEAVG